MTASGTPPASPAPPRVLRWAAPAGVAVLAAVGVLLAEPEPQRVAGGVLAVVAGAALAPTPRRGTAAVVLATAGVALTCWGSASDVGWFAVVVLAGWTALVTRGRVWAAYVGALVVLFAVQVPVHPDPGWAPWVFGTVFAAVSCRLSRRQRELTDQLRRAQQELAERARLDERARVAREVHDVVAHSLTVSLLHISSARLAVQDDPDGAAAALSEAERLNRAALGEVRQTVGMLRERRPGRPDEPSTIPLPGVERLPELVADVRRAGMDVDYAADPLPPELPGTTGLAVYRVVQEALTNAARHAPGVLTTVRVRRTGDGVDVQVRSATVAAGPPTAGGTGLSSMRERARAVGGDCTAGPQPDGSWAVRAEFPVSAPVAPATP